VFDTALAGVAVIVLSPLLVATALVVLLTMGRPVFFQQARPGLGEKPFRLVKFRTMRPAVPGRSLADDGSRITRLGSFLRKTSLDELPSLWNVLRGDMSLVGPRPLLLQYVTRYTPTQARRHEVRPGITGLAQVSGRDAIDWDDRLALDVTYVDTVSWATDLRILARTVGLVLRAEGVTEAGRATKPEFKPSGHPGE
jgi:lipopolysaccharide/colanic/teichoic acid biosynthesis glycosyltransferase